jgi:hypothetical protein
MESTASLGIGGNSDHCGLRSRLVFEQLKKPNACLPFPQVANQFVTEILLK